MSTWLRSTATGVILTIHVQPAARKSEVVGTYGEALKIRLAAPPVDGKANAALIDYLAARLAIPKNRIELKSGHASRHKVLAIQGIEAAAATKFLMPDLS